MIIGSIDIEPEDPSKQIKIPDDIGYNPNKRGITRIQNYNMNTLREKNNDDLEKLTYHFLELMDSNKVEQPKPKKSDNSLNNNYFESILYPDTFNEKNNLKKTVPYDGGTFLTDKINLSNIDLKSTNTLKEKKESKTKEEYTTSLNTNSNINNFSIKAKAGEEKNNINIGIETVPELKRNIPVSLDKLIVNIKDGKNKPKPINPLFFIINGDKPPDKTKFLNFRTNPTLFTSTMNKKNSIKNLEDFYKKNNKLENNILSQTPKFSTCFNKTCENKSKLNFDLKKKIFNDKNTSTEEKYRLLKDLQRNELMNRALGRGIFSCNKYFDDEKRAIAIQRRNVFEKFLEDSKEKLVLNYRTNQDIFDDKKKSFQDSQKMITHNYLPIVEDIKKYDKIEFKDRDMFLFNSGKINKKIESLYKPESRQRINNQVLIDTKMDKILKKARFDYEKPYSYLVSNIKKDKAI